jgi:putative drug exporter of the RND superfamily
VGLAFGVLMDTFIDRTVLMQCTVLLLGRWNWWPSALSRTGAQPGGASGPDGEADPGGPAGPGEGTEQDTEPAAPRTR